MGGVMRSISKPMLNLFSVMLGALMAVAAVSRLPLERMTPVAGAPGAMVKIKVEETPPSRERLVASSFAPAVRKAAPSVVTIFSTRTVREDPSEAMMNNPLFRHFFGDDLKGPSSDGKGPSNPHAKGRRAQGLGSGVICTEDGYILTNFHVVEDAEEIKVGLADGRTEFTGKLIGTDPQTDVAVIKIEGTNLPAITMGNSDNLEIGDVVLAVGNPFGLGQAVTMGVASAVGRGGYGIEDIEDFIQTDASINPGNSGGALVDSEGRLVGINTAILSRTGGNQGVGFAVPINLARGVMERILQYGRVVRGYLGVSVQPLTPELTRAFNLPAEQIGALVGDVSTNSPAAKAGVKEGDIITEYNGKEVEDSRQLRLMVTESSPNDRADMKILRGGKEQNLTATLVESPQPATPAAQSSNKRSQSGKGDASQGVLDTIVVTDLNGVLRQKLEIPTTVKGALVAKVEPGSAVYMQGLRSGDVILEINGQRISDANAAVQMGRKSGATRALLRVWSKGGSHYVAIESRAEGRSTG
jgi:serine protease Do